MPRGVLGFSFSLGSLTAPFAKGRGQGQVLGVHSDALGEEQGGQVGQGRAGADLAGWGRSLKSSELVYKKEEE